MTVPTSFETFRKALEIDKATVDSAADLQQRARKALEALPGFERSFLSGSYARNTRLDPLNDIDIVVVVADTAEWNDDPETAMRAAGGGRAPGVPRLPDQHGRSCGEDRARGPADRGRPSRCRRCPECGLGQCARDQRTTAESDLEAERSRGSPRRPLQGKRGLGWSPGADDQAGQALEPQRFGRWPEVVPRRGPRAAHLHRVRRPLGCRDDPEVLRRGEEHDLDPTTNPAVPDGVVDGDLTGDERASHSDRLAKASKAADDAVSVAKTDEDAAEDIWYGLFGDPFPKPVRDDANGSDRQGAPSRNGRRGRRDTHA